MRTICVTILLSVFMAGSVPAQGTYNFRHVGIEDGLSQGSVYHMLKDSHGYLWMSSQDGVNKFNGNKFEVYLSGSSGESTNVQGIAEDVDGAVWIGSHKGIFKYERKKNKFEKIAYTGLPVSSSIHVFADANKNIFFLCETGLYALAGKETRLLTKRLSYNRSQFNNFLTTTPDGDIWLLMPGLGINRFSVRTGKTIHYLINNSTELARSQDQFSCITTDREGNVWLGGKQKLVRVDYKTHQPTSFDTQWKDYQFTFSDITEDNNGMLWLATEKNGIVLFDLKRKKITQHIQHEEDVLNSLKFNEVSNVFIDENNDVFANTDPQGVDIITSVPSAFSTYIYGKNPDYNLNGYSVRGLAEDKNADIWIGTELGGLNRLNPSTGSIKHYTTKNGLPDNIIRHVLKDENDKVWIATLNSLAIYLPESDRFQPIELPVFCEISNLLSIDPSILLLITNKGILLLDTVEMTIVQTEIKQFVGGYASYHDKNTGLIYISSRYRGVDVFQMVDKQLRPLRKLLLNYHVLHLHPSPKDDLLWAATDQGLVKWDLKQNRILKSYHVEDGLHHEYIYCIQEDKSENLWLSTNRGLTRFRPDVERFEFVKEIPPREYNSRSSLATRSGDLYFGSTRGLDRIRPRLLNLRRDKVQVHLTEIAPDEARKDGSDIQAALDDHISLPYSDNTFTLKFTALDFRSAGLNRFRYFMKGYDKDTIYAGTTDQVRYAKLPAGTYEFQIQASDLGGNWVSAVRKLSIVISPPFWQTWWFILFMFVLFTGIVFLAIRTYLNEQLLAQKIESEKRISLERERARIARDINDSLGSELFGLKLLGQVAMHQSGKEEVNAYLQRMIDTSKNISDQISEVIWVTDSDQDNAESLWSYIKKNADIYLRPSGISYHFSDLCDHESTCVSGERRHEILNFHKLLFSEVTKSFNLRNCNLTFNISPSQLTTTLKGAEFPNLYVPLQQSLNKLKGSLSSEPESQYIFSIPLQD
jgi:ligand-binding sensor domain-containing protein